jgi:pyrroline-5-carboxylate reductase
MKIGFIGMGKMAEVIWGGVSKSQIFNNTNSAFFDVSQDRCSYIKYKYGLSFFNIDKLINESDIILFCVKPQQLKDLLTKFPLSNLQNKLFITIAAGIKIDFFVKYLGQDIQIVRVMPNTPALVGEAMSALTFSPNVEEKYIKIAKEIFAGFGQIEIVEEKDLDIVTGISGSGPAFLYKIADDVAKIGQKEGLDYNKSLKLIAQTMVGAGKMLIESEKSPEELIKDVSSPNGTTVAGLEVFAKSKITEEMQAVVLAAIKRSRELGK